MSYDDVRNILEERYPQEGILVSEKDCSFYIYKTIRIIDSMMFSGNIRIYAIGDILVIGYELNHGELKTKRQIDFVDVALAHLKDFVVSLKDYLRKYVKVVMHYGKEYRNW